MFDIFKKILIHKKRQQQTIRKLLLIKIKILHYSLTKFEGYFDSFSKT